jgi:predicted DNA binding CopG/RHH family protein
MEKRYQVFVSSTYQDLQEERQEVIQALLELDCIPAGMELFPAADEDQWTLIKKVIDDCDYYVVVVGGRYGSLAPAGISYTQMEYEYAVQTGKPTVGFLHKDPGMIPSSRTEQTAEGKRQLEEFREVVQRKMCKFWASPSELGSVVSRSLVKLIKSHPAIGWVRADNILDEGASTEILRLQKRVDELVGTIESMRREGPSGSENLAQGDAKFEIHYQYEVKYSSEVELLLSGPDIHLTSMEASWNEIFATIAPYMIDKAAEESLRTALDGFLRSRELTALQARHSTDRRVESIRIMEDDFQTIKIQLRALGLMAKSNRPRSVKDNANYWSLTPYGDNILTGLRAIRRQLP